MTDLKTDPNINRLITWLATRLLDMVLFVIDIIVFFGLLLASAYATFKISDEIIGRLGQTGQDILASAPLSFALVVPVLALCFGALHLAWAVFKMMVILGLLRLTGQAKNQDTQA